MGQTVKIESNLTLYPWQKDVINNVFDIQYRKGYIHVVKSKRQVGKSIMLELILLKTAVENPKSVSICLSPTLEQARKVFKEIKNVIKASKIYRRHNDIQLYIQLLNGAEIMFKSAEQKDALRGYTVRGSNHKSEKGFGVYVIDEASFINDDVFYETLAWVNVSQSPIVMVSTPKHKVGFFYKYYQMGFENGNKILSYDWGKYDTSELLPPEKLEQYRREIPAAQFRTEFLGEFLDNESSVFGDYDDVINDNYDDTLNTYMGIDWGTGVGGDETAISLFNSDRQMVALYHFNDKDETQTINYIVELIRKHQPLKIQVETNSIGQVYWGLLDKAIKAAGLPVQLLRFTTTNESKERLINQFQVAIQNKTVQILNNQTLQVQLDMYEMKVNQNGKRIYNAANGYHDDVVIATLLAFNCISSGNYCIR